MSAPKCHGTCGVRCTTRARMPGTSKNGTKRRSATCTGATISHFAYNITKVGISLRLTRHVGNEPYLYSHVSPARWPAFTATLSIRLVARYSIVMLGNVNDSEKSQKQDASPRTVRSILGRLWSRVSAVVRGVHTVARVAWATLSTGAVTNPVLLATVLSGMVFRQMVIKADASLTLGCSCAEGTDYSCHNN